MPGNVAEYLIRNVQLRLGNESWRILFTHRVLIQADAKSFPLEAAPVRRLLWHALRSAGMNLSEKDAGALLARDFPRIHRVLLDAWTAAMPAPEAVAAEEPGDPIDWMEAWSIAKIDLKLTDSEWLDMTPRQIHVLSRAHFRGMQREEYLAGTIAAAAANFGGRGPKDPFSARDFMVHPYDEPEPPPVTEEHLRGIFSSFPKE